MGAGGARRDRFEQLEPDGERLNLGLRIPGRSEAATKPSVLKPAAPQGLEPNWPQNYELLTILLTTYGLLLTTYYSVLLSPS